MHRKHVAGCATALVLSSVVTGCSGVRATRRGRIEADGAATASNPVVGASAATHSNAPVTSSASKAGSATGTSSASSAGTSSSSRSASFFAASSAGSSSSADPSTTFVGPLAPSASKDVLSWETGEGKSYLIPALDIIGFELLLNQFDRHVIDSETYGSDLDSIESNLEHGWVIDRDPFAINQFGHPYQGSMYHGFARSAGLNYWWSLGYDFGGSTLWEIAGETDPPSLNDEITTTFGGSFLGEALFRISNLVIESGGTHPSSLRRFSAGLISPAAGFNRLAYGKRFDAPYPSDEAATNWSASIGASRDAKVTDVASLGSVQEDQAIATTTVDYGLPGRTGYEYEQPFDYFHFEAGLVSNAIPENIQVRGLLVGSDYDAGDSYRGVWGLYGSYDYIAPELFSLSSTALSIGTTGQWWLGESVALQGTVMGGVGWTAIGTLADAEEDRDYTYGYSPQALVSLRTVFGDRVALDVTGRQVHVDGPSSVDRSGSTDVVRVQATLTVRVVGHHGLSLQFVGSRRDSALTDVDEALQEVGTVSLMYTFLGDEDLGVVRW